MNDKFFSLPKEKQLNIVNAAMEVFGGNEYKRASTHLIAAKAGISKGLLFYYFKNKKQLYLYTYNYLVETMSAMAGDNSYLQITDFFELMEYFSKLKLEIMEEVPSIGEFAARAFYSDKEAVSEDLKKINTEMVDMIFHTYFGHVDYGKFKSGFDPYKIYQMIIWMADGYLHEHQMNGHKWTLDEIMEEYSIWTTMLRKMAYKEEYINECD